MRLIHTTALDIKYFVGNNVPKYAILSHTWGGEEVTHQDWANRANILNMEGYQKIVSACELAKEDGYAYLWVDTNCIDKSSSSELAEAINSMFEWYTLADICYAYLSDVETYKPLTGTREIRRSRWFRRGWTLQELLAPRQVNFYAADWSKLGTRTTLARHISAATGIALKYLHAEEELGQENKLSSGGRANDTWMRERHAPIHAASVAERMAWLARRETTRVEDIAYCALGIFAIHMPLVYGEGPRAFTRLQEEILRVSTDHSLFCWSWGAVGGRSETGLLSPRPQGFLEAGLYSPRRLETRPRPYAMTNAGLSIHLPLVACWSSFIAVLEVEAPDCERGGLMGISMSGRSLAAHQFMRRTCPDVPIPLCAKTEEYAFKLPEILVPLQSMDVWQTGRWGTSRPLPSVERAQCRAGVLLSFGSRDHFERISTKPPGRFSADDSIVYICPQEARNDSSDLSPQPQPDAFEGATIVKFLMKWGMTETILFVVSSSAAGSFFQPCWHFCHLPDELSLTGVPEPLRRILDETINDGSSLSRVATPRLEQGREIKGTTQSSPVTDHLSESSWTSVQIASSGFLTTAGSMLKHVHVDSKLHI